MTTTAATTTTTPTTTTSKDASHDVSACPTENPSSTTITTSSGDDKLLNDLLQDLRTKYPHQPTFLQAVQEMAVSLLDLFQDSVDGAFYQRAFLTMTEPERVIAFRVPWMDDAGHLHINRGWRVEFNSVLGPYKGGLRFHPTVDEGVLKFLGFEQIFKNALTGLPLGGGKGGSDFDPKGKSDAEVRRFCESFMTELYRYLHPSTDVPAGDIGVGGREIGYLYGQYKRLTNKHGEGVLTGKSLAFGGSPLRPEATGYGLVYMTQLAVQGQLKRSSLEGMQCAISGSGNVAQFAAQKLLYLGAKVMTMSDSSGVLVFPNGMTRDDWNIIVHCKTVDRARLSSIQHAVSGVYYAKESPWTLAPNHIVPYDLALPCATQNEIDASSAQRLVQTHGIVGVLEGANLPTTIAAQEYLRSHNILYIPGKASNAGGVGVSGLEMSQNAQRLTWKAEEVDQKLQDMMKTIYHLMEQEQQTGDDSSAGKGTITLEQGANRAGFLKVAKAMKELGWVY